MTCESICANVIEEAHSCFGDELQFQACMQCHQPVALRQRLESGHISMLKHAQQVCPKAPDCLQTACSMCDLEMLKIADCMWGCRPDGTVAEWVSDLTPSEILCGTGSQCEKRCGKTQGEMIKCFDGADQNLRECQGCLANDFESGKMDHDDVQQRVCANLPECAEKCGKPCFGPVQNFATCAWGCRAPGQIPPERLPTENVFDNIGEGDKPIEVLPLPPLPVDDSGMLDGWCVTANETMHECISGQLSAENATACPKCAFEVAQRLRMSGDHQNSTEILEERCLGVCGVCMDQVSNTTGCIDRYFSSGPTSGHTSGEGSHSDHAAGGFAHCQERCDAQLVRAEQCLESPDATSAGTNAAECMSCFARYLEYSIENPSEDCFLDLGGLETKCQAACGRCFSRVADVSKCDNACAAQHRPPPTVDHPVTSDGLMQCQKRCDAKFGGLKECVSSDAAEGGNDANPCMSCYSDYLENAMEDPGKDCLLDLGGLEEKCQSVCGPCFGRVAEVSECDNACAAEHVPRPSDIPPKEATCDDDSDCSKRCDGKINVLKTLFFRNSK